MSVPAPFRQTPTKASRKQAVLEFIKRHFAARGESPSYREIAAALDTNIERVKDAIHALVNEGKVRRRVGQRGLLLPEPVDQVSLGDALLRLRQAGFVVDEDVVSVDGPPAVTLYPLPILPPFEHLPDID